MGIPSDKEYSTMCQGIDEWYEEINRLEKAGILTYKEAPYFHYLKLTSGKHKNRIVIKLHNNEIDGKSIAWFATKLTWIYTDQINDCTCVRAKTKI
jgi:hypothetical protein